MSLASIVGLTVDLCKSVGLDTELDDDKGLGKFFKNVFTFKRNATNLKLNTAGSIKNQTKDLILQFPILCSNTLSSDTMNLLSKGFEYEYANLVGIYINNSPICSEQNTIAFLRRFHKNIQKGYMESVDEKSIIAANKKLMEDHANINEWSLISESKKNKNGSGKTDINYNYDGDDQTIIQPKGGYVSGDYVKEKIDRKIEFNHNNNNKYDLKSSTIKKGNEVSINGKDVQSLNDKSPTIVKVKISMIPQDQNNVKTSDGTTINMNNVIEKDLLFGVKSVLHLLPNEEVAYYLADTTKGSNMLFKLIRWTTGELHFFRDLFFGVELNKKLAKDTTKSGSFWWKKLKSMGENRKLRASADAINDGKSIKDAPIPVATMVISKFDVENIKSKYGVDIMRDGKYGFKIVNTFMLLNFVIVDESCDLVSIFDESTKNYIQYNLADFKSKDNGKQVINLKDIIPLIKR